MRQLTLLFVPLATCLFFAYSGGPSSSTKDSTAATQVSAAAAPTTAGGDASWSCKFDGKDLSGKGTDQIVNAASIHSPGVLYFGLASSFTGDPGADIRLGGFGFEVPDKGTTVIRGVEAPDYSIAYNLPNDPTKTYSCKEMTVTINSSATRVTGTFSGTLIEPKTSRQVPVTEGKFDIPMSSLGKQ